MRLPRYKVADARASDGCGHGCARPQGQPEDASKPHRGIGLEGELVMIPAGTPVGVSFEQSQATLQGRRIWLMNSDGADQTELTRDSRFRDERPLWAADGNHILFARLARNGAVSLWWMSLSGGEPSMVADGLSLPRRPLKLPDGREVGEAWWEYYGRIRWELFFDWHR